MRGPTAAAVLLAILVAACRLGGPRTFEVRLASPGEEAPPLDVVVVDHAGVVTGVEGAAATTAGGGCLLIGVARGVVLELDRDIAAERFRLVAGAGT